MRRTHIRPLFALEFQHKRAANQEDKAMVTAGEFAMLLAFITSWFQAKPAFVWKPALTLTDPRIVSELTDSLN
jgi:hypothetical protein